MTMMTTMTPVAMVVLVVLSVGAMMMPDQSPMPDR
jgi:hypothetical protein